MNRTILIGHDGTPEGEDALALGKLLATPLSAEVATARIEPAPAPHRPDVARRLFERAEQERATILVIGSSHHAGLGAVVAGSVGREVLQRAPCTVALAPRGYRDEDDRLRVIGVGYDATPAAEHALAGAIEVARGAEGTMRVIGALTPMQGPHDNVGRHDALRDAVSAAVDRCPPELRADPRARPGDAAEVLRDEAEMGLDLLAIGSHGYGPVLRALVGSVSAKLMRAAPCPLLVFPRDVPGISSPAEAA